MDEKKYNNGKVENIPENSTEMSLAIREWSENYKPLENAIGSCIDNNVPTIASCAGHSLMDSAYISMPVNKENLGKIINIMNSVANIRNTEICLSYMESQGTILTVSSDMFHRKSMFNTIEKSTTKTMDIGEAFPNVQDLWNAHKELRLHDVGHSLEVTNSRFSQRLILRPYSDELSHILDDLKLKKDDYTGCYYKTFISKKGLKNFYQDMIENVDNVCYRKQSDELTETMQSKNNIRETIEKCHIKPVNLEEKNGPSHQKDREIEE